MAAKTATKSKPARPRNAKHGKASHAKAPAATAQEILKHVKPAKLEAHTDVPSASKPARGRKAKAPLTAKAILKAVAGKPGKVEAHKDTLEPQLRRAADILKELRKENFEFRRAQTRKDAFDPNAFAEFFAAEIEAEVSKPATIFNDRFARWRCQCCDVIIPVPRRTTVLHGDYVLEHDDVLGLIVNGERWVPKAETPLEVVQPGRLRNPWTGRTLEGRDLGTTGVY